MGQLPGSTTNFETVDGTGFFVYDNSESGQVWVYDASGTKYTDGTNGVRVEDANGNQITAGSGAVTDTVGRSIPNPSSASNNSGAGNCPSGALTVISNATWTVPGPNGGSSTFLFCYVQINVIYEYEFTGSGNTTLTENSSFLQSIVLPNGTAWSFQYSSGTGNLTQITLPTGGTITYVWNSIGGCTGLPIDLPFLTSRTVNANDGTNGHTWNYTYNGNNTVTVEDPLGNYTVYTNQYLSYCSNYTTSVQYYQGAVSSNNLLRHRVPLENR
jgi:hypothetical protein